MYFDPRRTCGSPDWAGAYRHSFETRKCSKEHIPYSGTFSRVQIFAKILFSVQKNFSRLPEIGECNSSRVQIFAVLIFAFSSNAKSAKICTPRKIPAIRLAGLVFVYKSGKGGLSNNVHDV